MSELRRIYLDNAATSWPKPESVYCAVTHAMRELGAPAGRGTYAEATEVERLLRETRRGMAQLLGTPEARSVIFTANGTDSLNLAIHGMLRPGDHVVTSMVEHNSTLRPLRQAQEHQAVTVTRVPCNGEGLVNPDDIRAAIQPHTRMIAMVHVSNVTGAIQPVSEVGKIAAEHQICYLVDAAQSLGHLPFDLEATQADLVAAPGHKGLLGPLGSGILYIHPKCEAELMPIRQGGTGTQSETDAQPETLPDRFESGNHNVPSLLGLRAGIAYLAEQGVTTICDHEQQLAERLRQGLREIKGLQIYGPQNVLHRAGVVSLRLDGYEPQELAMLLDSHHRIQARAGFHCAPLVHKQIGTDQQGGTLRLSVGALTTIAEIDTAVEAIGEIASAAPF
ncbi:MAG: aminotransferase class V-fold PLP-dependent enzyme [Planctomycetota bacterium]|nr:aminotransferase class V-fold PLP-dependent enzyme [Planctomycetota bacterium]